MPAKPQPIPLEPDSLHVWTASISEDATPLTDDTLAVLSADELARAQRFHHHADQLLFTWAHVAVRQTLSRYALIPAQDWTFEIGQHGRPEISHPDAPKGLRFNLSHTHGMIAIIVNCCFDAGVDVEGIGRVDDLGGMSRICFTTAERDELLALPEAQQALRFTQLWALKESFIKAMGTGMTTPLKSFSFDLSSPSLIGFNCSHEVDHNPLAWSFSVTTLLDQHVLATAIRLGTGKTANFKHFSLSIQ